MIEIKENIVPLIISLSLLLVAITTIAPIRLSSATRGIIKGLALALLGFSLFKNFFETTDFVKSYEFAHKNALQPYDIQQMKFYVLLSHILSLSIFALILYVIVTILM
jgi:hypothetical protein